MPRGSDKGKSKGKSKSSSKKSAKAKAKHSSPARQRTGGFWVVLVLILGGIFTAVTLAPKALYDNFGPAMEPSRLGSEPSLSSDTSGETTQRATNLEARKVNMGQTQLESGKEAPPIDDAPKAKIDTGPADQTQGLAVLAKADTAYKSYNWDEARSLARQITNMDVDAKTKVRAEDILRGADALEDMFTKLNTKDELVRAWDTHPSLVVINSRGQDSHFIPVLDITDKEVPETKDPVGWIKSRLAARGKVSLLLDSGAGTEMRKQDISAIRPADIDRIMADRQSTFSTRLRKVQKGAMATDPLMWYEAAKFAYRNRLDDKVTEMLDKAIELDPLLADSIREDKAQGIFLKMVQLMEKQNKTGAAIWMDQLKKYYEETTIYPQARAYYSGNLEKLAMASKEAKEAKKRRREEARAKRIERAKKLKDEQLVKRIKEEPKQEVYEAPQAGPEVSGDAGGADQAMGEGMQLLAQAQSMPVSDERDNVYRKAQVYFDKAKAIYEKLGMEAKAVQANQYRYACIKYRRVF